MTSWSEYPTELTFVEMAARIHHRLVFIHPFENGNGRFSRLIADRFLLAYKCQYPTWPNHLNKESSIRKEYIQTLKSADKGDYSSLIKFMKKFGACDPKLNELFGNNFYRALMKSARGLAIVNALLRNKESPNDETSNGHQVLQLAIKAGLDELVKRLVSSGAKIDVIDQSGLTPFQVAMKKKNTAIADFLISKGAS